MADTNKTADPARLHGFGYASGRYDCLCIDCKNQFVGSKRSVRCEPCAEIAATEWESLSPDERAARRERNSAIVERMLKEHGW